MKKNLKRIKALILAGILFIAWIPQAVWAEGEGYGYEVSLSQSPAAIGSEVTVTVSLTDYTEDKAGIRGFQIDINNVDGILANATCTSLVTDQEDVLSDSAKYQSGRDLVRHMYVKMSGTLDYAQKDLLQVSFLIPDTYTEAGILQFPMSIRIQGEDGKKHTYESTIEVSYALAGDIPDQPGEIISVDLVWGEMEFTYSDGLWNPQTHQYSDSGWTGNGNTIRVINTGNGSVTASVSYKNQEGYNFTGNWDKESEKIESGSEETFTLNIQGTPESELNKQVIGTVTVQIGGE